MTLRKFTDFGAASRCITTLRANQGLFISSGLLHKFKATDVKAVQLYVDDESPMLGIEFLDNYSGDSDEVRRVTKEKSGISINVSPILRYYEVRKISKKINIEARQEGKLLVIDLKKVVESEKTP